MPVWDMAHVQVVTWCVSVIDCELHQMYIIIEQVTRFLMMQSMIINFCKGLSGYVTMDHKFCRAHSPFLCTLLSAPNPTPVSQARCPIPAAGLLQIAST